jgi:hypothetical protein
MPLLVTKRYVPPARPEPIPRLCLIEHLNAELLGQGNGFAHKRTFIFALAGFGNTTLTKFTHIIPTKRREK